MKGLEVMGVVCRVKEHGLDTVIIAASGDFFQRVRD